MIQHELLTNSAPDIILHAQKKESHGVGIYIDYVGVDSREWQRTGTSMGSNEKTPGRQTGSRTVNRMVEATGKKMPYTPLAFRKSLGRGGFYPC